MNKLETWPSFAVALPVSPVFHFSVVRFHLFQSGLIDIEGQDVQWTIEMVNYLLTSLKKFQLMMECKQG